jgi:hypothetical protein
MEDMRVVVTEEQRSELGVPAKAVNELDGREHIAARGVVLRNDKGEAAPMRLRGRAVDGVEAALLDGAGRAGEGLVERRGHGEEQGA